MTTRFGLQLWSQSTDWPGFRDAALAAEAAGWDSVWTWDHLLAIFGPWEQPILEGWTTLAALGPLTSRVRLGLMVGANTFRNPGPDGEARHVARSRLGRSGRPRDRRRLVRAGTRCVRAADSERAPASGSAGSTSRSCSCVACSTASASITTDRSTRSTTRSANHDRSRRGCRSSSVARAGAGRSGPWPSGPTPGTRRGRSPRCATRSTTLEEHCRQRRARPRDPRADDQLPDRAA